MPLFRLIIAAAVGLALTVASAVRADEANAPAPPVPLLWQVSDDDTTVYLLGSFHLLKPDDYPLPREVEAAFADAERIMFEISPDELARPEIAQQTLAAARYADGQTLSAVLPPALRGKFETLLAQRGATLAQFDGFEPWFVNLTLVMGLSNTLGFSAEHGLDQHLMRKAASAGKPATGLETVAAQMQALDATPLAEQLAALEDFVDDPDAARTMLSRLHAAWRRGDATELDTLTRAEMQRETPETYRIVNVERNRAWMPQLRAQLADPRDDVLVVVGAMHLLGEDGLVEQLRAQGLRVERVCERCAEAAGR